MLVCILFTLTYTITLAQSAPALTGEAAEVRKLFIAKLRERIDTASPISDSEQATAMHKGMKELLAGNVDPQSTTIIDLKDAFDAAVADWSAVPGEEPGDDDEELAHYLGITATIWYLMLGDLDFAYKYSNATGKTIPLLYELQLVFGEKDSFYHYVVNAVQMSASNEAREYFTLGTSNAYTPVEGLHALAKGSGRPFVQRFLVAYPLLQGGPIMRPLMAGDEKMARRNLEWYLRSVLKEAKLESDFSQLVHRLGINSISSMLETIEGKIEGGESN